MNPFKTLPHLALASLVFVLSNLSTQAQQVQPPSESRLPDSTVMNVVPGADRPGSDPLQMILQSEKVQKELGLTETQVAKLQQIYQEAHAGLTTQRSRSANPAIDFKKQAEDTRQQVSQVLKPDQLDRFREVLLQVNGWTPEVTTGRSRGNTPPDPLKLSSEQQQEYANVRGSSSETVRSNFTRTRSTNPQEVCKTVMANQEQLAPIRQERQQQAMALLSSEQQATIKDLKGEPFEIEQRSCTPATSNSQ